MTVAISQH